MEIRDHLKNGGETSQMSRETFFTSCMFKKVSTFLLTAFFTASFAHGQTPEPGPVGGGTIGGPILFVVLIVAIVLICKAFMDE